MRKLIVCNFVTIDGYYESKDKTIDSMFEYYPKEYAGDQNFDIYNLLNANTTTSINNTCCTTTLTGWQAITSVMQARQVRIGVQFDW